MILETVKSQDKLFSIEEIVSPLLSKNKATVIELLNSLH